MKPTADELAEHAGFVHALARRLLFDHHQAADVAQDALVCAMEGGPGPRRTVRGWLAGVVRNRARLTLRHDRRREAREAKTARPDRSPATSDVAAQLEVQRRLVEAVQALPEHMRTAIVLRFFNGMPPRRIARRLGVPVETVKSRLKRGLDALRVMLDERYGSRRSWCLVVAPLLVCKPVAAATAAAGGVGQLVLGGLAMKAGAVVVAAVTVSVGLVIAIAVHSSGEEASKRQQVRAAADERTPVAPGDHRVSPPEGSAASSDTPVKTGKEADKRTGLKTRPASERAQTPAEVAAYLDRLKDAIRLIKLRGKKGKKRSRKPDGITRAYLDAMTAEFGRLPAGDDRVELLGRLVKVHRDYLRRTGDDSFLPWLEGAMDSAGTDGEQRRLVRAVRQASDVASAELLVRWSQHVDARVRRHAVGELSSLTGEAGRRAGAPIMQALRDPDAGVRRAAAAGVTRIAGKKSNVGPLVRALAAETDLGAAKTMMSAILSLDRKGGRNRIAAATRNSSEPIRKAATQLQLTPTAGSSK